MTEPMQQPKSATRRSLYAAHRRTDLARDAPGIDLLVRLGPLRVCHFRQREVFYREGERPQCLYAVASGRIKLSRYVTEGRARTIRLLDVGDLLGLGALFGDDHGETAVALEDASVYAIPMRRLQSLKACEPALYCDLLENCYSHLAYADTWITQFSTGPIRARVARLVDFLCAEPALEGLPPMVRLLTCEETAEALGVTPESVSRALAEFKRERLLRRASISDPELFVCDVPGLRAVALS